MLHARYREPLITDLAEAMGWMQFFRPAEKTLSLDEYLEIEPLGLSSIDQTIAPIRRPTPKIGRNEPCPCGSGKKFKKCCGLN